MNTEQRRIGNARDFVPIKSVRDNIVILDDGTLVAIVLATSVNLALKSYEEQEATISAFRGFLNVLDFPVQIVVQSRKMDIQPYLDLLNERMKEQENELIKLQTEEYINFIKNFTSNVNIMDKNFFLVVSYKPLIGATSSGGIGFLSKIFGSNKKFDENDIEFTKAFEEAKLQLEQRVSLLSSSLRATGVKTKLLDTETILELFHSIYNPELTI